jgi:F420-dependent oxidoreductase-like protein
MRVAVQSGFDARSWPATVDFVREADRLGVHSAWVAEAWGADAVSVLGYLAAVTEQIRLGSGILQISSRTPAMTGRTALTLSALTGGRFILGLGASGPQVVEGLDGQPFAHPLGRMRETIDIVRLVASGEKVAYDGRHFRLPRPGGEGKALRVGLPAEPELPVYLATLSPRMLELTGEVADGWLGTSFTPSGAAYYTDHIGRGALRAGRSLADVELSAGGDVAFSDDIEGLVAARKPGLAFSLGGMGSPTTNFYNDAYSAQGWAEVAEEVRRLWVDGRRDDAARAVPDEMVLETTMIGTEDMVRDRMRTWRDSGISLLRVYPSGRDLDERVATLGRAVELVEELNAEP